MNRKHSPSPSTADPHESTHSDDEQSSDLVGCRYRMKGMGTLLHVYSKAGGATEAEFEKRTQQLGRLQSQTDANKEDTEIARKIQKLKSRQATLRKNMQQFLRGAAQTMNNAADNLSDADTDAESNTL